MAYAQDINERGDVVGFSNVAGDRDAMGLFDARAFVWFRGSDTAINLETLDPDHAFSQAQAINTRRQVVGLSFVGAPSRAFLWQHGKLFDLNDLAGPDFGPDPDAPLHRRFFETAAAAEAAGFRPYRRCQPERAPGRSLLDAVSRLADTAADRIAGGAVNGRTVASLARELCVSERHLRRSLERELGASPLELAQIHRLQTAERLLAETALSVSRIAFASGFQGLRRFNAVVRERYGMTPTELRRALASVRGPAHAGNGWVRSTPSTPSR